jgi:hypothetical protein
MDEQQQNPQDMEKKDAPKAKPPKGGSPFLSGFVPNGRRKVKSQSYLSKKNLLKHMLEVDITIADLPVKLADELRKTLPGWFDDVEKRFNMLQIMELTQFQLLFSKSDYVKQDAITQIKDRVYGKPKQTLSIEPQESDPTELKLPNGRVIII